MTETKPTISLQGCETSAWRLIARADRIMADLGMYREKRLTFLRKAGVKEAAKYPGDETPKRVWLNALTEVREHFDIVG